MIEFREAKSWHVGQIVRLMRADHHAAAVARGGDAHHELSRVFRESSYRRAAFVDGRLTALWGVTGMLASGKGHVWLVLSQDTERVPLAVVIGARKELRSLLDTHQELTTTLFDGDQKARRFALLLGFRPTEISHGMTWMRLRRDVPVSRINARTDAPFIIFGLPRSRTTWLSEFLSYGEKICLHDSMLEMNGFEGMRDFLSRPNTGICETGFVMAWPVLKRYFPKARFVVVRRPVKDVREELLRFRWEFMPGHLEWMVDRLNEVSNLPGTLTIDFADLNNEETCKRVFEHCLGQPFDREWWTYWRDKNIQIDMDKRLRRLAERAPAMQNLVGECEDLMSPVTFQVESWETFKRDGHYLFDEHRAEVGKFQDLDYDPDFERAATFDRLGRLQVMTARAGRKMIGYLLFIIDQHPESKHVLIGVQNTFFVTKSFRGIGLRLHAEALRALKSRGVEILSMSAGVRGSGPKLAALYKRLGAIEERRVYSLRIN